MNSSLFTLNFKDFSKGLVVAVLTVLLGAFQEALRTNGLELSTFDWSGILTVTWQAVVVYLAKNALSDEEGKVFGKIG